jgi:hypothetical protein
VRFGARSGAVVACWSAARIPRVRGPAAGGCSASGPAQRPRSRPRPRRHHPAPRRARSRRTPVGNVGQPDQPTADVPHRGFGSGRAVLRDANECGPGACGVYANCAMYNGILVIPLSQRRRLAAAVSEVACLPNVGVDRLKLALSRMVKRNIDVEVEGSSNPIVTILIENCAQPLAIVVKRKAERF